MLRHKRGAEGRPAEAYVVKRGAEVCATLPTQGKNVISHRMRKIDEGACQCSVCNFGT